MSRKSQNGDEEGPFSTNCGGKPRPKPLPRHQNSRHQFETVFFRMPVICCHCSDYIWGEGKVGVKCSNCGSFCHTSCQHLVSIPCSAMIPHINDSPRAYTEPQRVEEWDIYEVKKWMAVVNLHRYSEIFSNNNINGEKLLKLDENKIKSMNIKDEFHISAILGSIDSLKRLQDNLEVLPSLETEGLRHEWSVYSFTSMQSCHVCGQFLHGIVQQGFQCQVCGLCCHRKCSCFYVNPCDVEGMKNFRRPSFNGDSMFGRRLTNFPDIPPVLLHCVNFLERQGCNVLKFYRKTPPTNEVNLLKNMFDRNVDDLLTLDLSSFGGSVVGGVLKKFLRDLPDPIIPEEFYDSFIQLDEENRNELVEHLPSIHKKTLNFLISHLRKDSPDNICHLAKVFNQILMRPPWAKIMDIIDNTRLQTRCIELLLRMQDGDLPPRHPIPPSSPWYWGNISKEKANEMTQNTPDGTYLVRDSINRDEYAPYTLTLRSGSSNKNFLIKILCSNGNYGLMEPLNFRSVDELINYYTHHSLAEFNNNFDLKLRYPILKRNEGVSDNLDISQLRNRFRDLCKRHAELEEKLECLYKEEESMSEEYRMKQVAITAYKQIISMYDEHLEAATNFKSSSGDIMSISRSSYSMMERKLQEVRSTVTMMQSELKNTGKEVTMVRKTLENCKIETMECSKDMEHKKQLLLKCGETPENLTLMGEGSEVISTDTVPHLTISLWLVMNCDRDGAEELLRNKPVGTFLVRPKGEEPCPLSIVIPDPRKVEHCLIKKMDTGYGFAEPFYIHKTLLDLVLHYKDTSLIEHNDQLNVTLKYPVYYKIP